VLTHNAILTKALNFKILEIYSTVSLVLSSIIALILAYFNFGVWALVYQQILNSLFNAIIVWYFQSWKPTFILHFKSIKSLLGFGFRVFISGLLNTFFGSIDTIIIGKFFSAASLGLYSFAQNLINVTVGTFTTAIVRVLFPVMAGAQNDAERLKSIYLKTNNLLNIFIIPVMGSICIFANQIVTIFLGNKWLDMVVYFQLFAIIGILYPISALNINLILAKGRSDKFLHLEIIKKILLVIGIAVGFQFGIVGILFGILGISLIGVLFNLYYAGNVSGYYLKNQLIDMMPVLALSGFYLIILYVSKLFFIPFTNNILGSILSILSLMFDW
jgi:O-antigen/teichoic acid export membrane protein